MRYLFITNLLDVIHIKVLNISSIYCSITGIVQFGARKKRPSLTSEIVEEKRNQVPLQRLTTSFLSNVSCLPS